jgi:hypothetical protein
MRRILMSVILGFVTTSVASACLNDSELKDHEREFRSTYNRGTEPQSSDSWMSNSMPVALLSGGSVFLIAAGVIASRRISAKP